MEKINDPFKEINLYSILLYDGIALTKMGLYIEGQHTPDKCFEVLNLPECAIVVNDPNVTRYM